MVFGFMGGNPQSQFNFMVVSFLAIVEGGKLSRVAGWEIVEGGKLSSLSDPQNFKGGRI